MVEAGEDAEEVGAVGDVASNGSRNGEGKPAEASGDVGDAAGRRAEADDVAEVGRVAERAAHVTAVGERSHAAGEGGGATTGAAAAGFGEIVWVMRGAEDGVECLGAEAPFRHVGFAEDDGAGSFFTLDDAAIEIGDEVFVKRGTVCGAHAGGFVQVFDGDGEAVQGAEPVAFGEGFVGLDGLCD